jgi:hypothetical protein
MLLYFNILKVIYVAQKMPTIMGYDCASPACLDHLEWLDTRRIISICVASPKVAKERRMEALRLVVADVLPKNFAHVNEHL